MSIDRSMTSGRSLIMAVLLIASASASADNSLPIDVRAEKLEMAIYGGRQILSGNVVVVQGGLTVSAEKLQIDTIKEAISRISGDGLPIVISDNTPGGKSFRASANSIDFQISKWTIVVEGNVKLEIPGVQLRGDRLVYDIRKARFVLTANPTSRVHATLVLPRSN